MSDRSSFKRFARHFLDNVAPNMRDSAYIITIAPGQGEEDVKIACEIGYCILLDKPLIVFAPNGRHMSPKLLRIADKVIHCDISDKASWHKAQEELQNYMQQ